MTRFYTGFNRCIFAAAAACWLVSNSPALANNDIWDGNGANPPSGVWGVGSNWLDNTTPGNGDEATFNLAGAYTVTFNGSPAAIQALTLNSAANVTFRSDTVFDPSTLRVTSPSGGGDVLLTNGVTLTLGTSGGILVPPTPLHLTVGDQLTVTGGARLNVKFNSDVVSTNADINTGHVNVSGSGSTWTNGFVLLVGSFGTGELTIEAGGSVSNTGGVIGRFFGSDGTATVTGAASTWTNNGSLFVGESGTGTLRIEAGGRVDNTNGIVGMNAVGAGIVNVDGVNSLWNNFESLIVAENGFGMLNISGGGAVVNTLGSIGQLSGSDGVVTVDGTNSIWTNVEALLVGVAGSGTLNITDGGFVSNAGSSIGGFTTGSTGTVNVDGVNSRWISSGDLAIGNAGTGTLTVSNGGLVSVGDRVAVGLLGTLMGDGQIDGDVDNFGVVAPGTSPGTLHLTGDFNQFASGKLNIELAGVTPGTQHDFMDVTGVASLNGELQLALIDGFVPSMQQTFTVFAASSISGSFSNIASGLRLDTVDGIGSFLVHYGAQSAFDQNQIVLTSFQLTGDLDGDGFVGITDLNIVLSNWNQTIPPGDPAADPSGDSFVGIEDLNIVLGNWNAGTPPGDGLANVPEPGSLTLLTLAGLQRLTRRRAPKRLKACKQVVRLARCRASELNPPNPTDEIDARPPFYLDPLFTSKEQAMLSRKSIIATPARRRLNREGAIMRRLVLVPLFVLALQATAHAALLQVNVTYTNGQIVSGPLSADLTELPESVEATFLLNGSSAGVFSIDDVVEASLSFGDGTWSGADLQEFSATLLEGDIGSLFVTALTYAYRPINTATVDGRIAKNFPLDIQGTDIASGQAFDYRYDSSTQTVTEVIPEPASAALALIGLGGLLIRRRRSAWEAQRGHSTLW